MSPKFLNWHVCITWTRENPVHLYISPGFKELMLSQCFFIIVTQFINFCFKCGWETQTWFCIIGKSYSNIKKYGLQIYFNLDLLRYKGIVLFSALCRSVCPSVCPYVDWFDSFCFAFLWICVIYSLIIHGCFTGIDPIGHVTSSHSWSYCPRTLLSFTGHCNTVGTLLMKFMGTYHKIFNTTCTKSLNLNASRLVLQMSLSYLLKPGV